MESIAMRKFFVLPTVLVLAMPVAHAQHHDDATRTTRAVDAGDAATAAVGAGVDVGMEAEADAADTSPSGFGQVMSVLTGLLQDAAQREATGRSDGFALDNPAIRISVTPVEGRTSLLRAPAAERATVGQRRAASGRELAGGSPQ